MKLNDLNKETDDLKLSKETSREITDKIYEEMNSKLMDEEQQNGNEINGLSQEDEYLHE